MSPQRSRVLMALSKERPKQGCWLSSEGEGTISSEVNRNIGLLNNDAVIPGPEVPNI